MKRRNLSRVMIIWLTSFSTIAGGCAWSGPQQDDTGLRSAEKIAEKTADNARRRHRETDDLVLYSSSHPSEESEDSDDDSR